MKFFFILTTFLCVCLSSSFAQSKNFYVGGSGPGSLRVASHIGDVKSDIYYFKRNFGATFNYETQFRGGVTLVEFGYGNYGLDKLKLGAGSTEALLDRDALAKVILPDGVDTYTLGLYYGYALNAPKRLQFPYFFGAGFDYITKPFSAGHFHVGAKARIKYYITGKIGIWAGINGRIGFGSGKYKDAESVEQTVMCYGVQYEPEGGLVFSF